MGALLVRIVFDGELARFLGTLVTVDCVSSNCFGCFVDDLHIGRVNYNQCA